MSLAVHLRKVLPLDLHHDYPCPCRRPGRLVPIVLTEALGCNLCQQIFILDEARQEIETVVSLGTNKPRWSWTGYGWRLKQSFPSPAWGTGLGILLFIVNLIGLFLYASFPWSVILGRIMIGLLLLLLVYTFWLLWRR